MSKRMFAGEAICLAEVLKWAPWILVIVLANAANEELLFRGLFLRKLEPFYGKLLSNCLIVLVFTGLHLGVTYTRDQALFLVGVMLLAFAWGAVMQKTDSIWGSILFHAVRIFPFFWQYSRRVSKINKLMFMLHSKTNKDPSCLGDDEKTLG